MPRRSLCGLSIWRVRKLERYHPLVADTLGYMAWLYRAAGQPGEAERFYREASTPGTWPSASGIPASSTN